MRFCHVYLSPLLLMHFSALIRFSLLNAAPLDHFWLPTKLKNSWVIIILDFERDLSRFSNKFQHFHRSSWKDILPNYNLCEWLPSCSFIEDNAPECPWKMFLWIIMIIILFFSQNLFKSYPFTLRVELYEYVRDLLMWWFMCKSSNAFLQIASFWVF